ncbi:MAG TPA: excinuclease ABC subunit UvrC [Candidatus Saccharimonadales bacterium]
MNTALETKLKTLPKEPGVYFHKGKSGEIIYVGKAAVLRNRVRQYFQASRARDPKTEALVGEIYDTDWMVVDSEIEALFLEAEMIRRYMPRYNILLRDDKAMSYIRIDYDSDYPTVTTTRRPLDDGARYFGPYFSTYAVRQALKLLRRIFPYATRRIAGQKRATLHYHLGLDPGLEEGRTSLEDYRKNLRKLIAIIEGKRTAIITEIEHDMKQAARSQEFELAARHRNQLFLLQNLSRQVVFSDKEFLDISKDRALSGLTELLGLGDYPKRIEGYDISHMQGTNVVASMVVFTNGVTDKSEYRKFKTSQRNDDPRNMHETLLRRLSEKNLKAWGVPDLILIDGGTQQVNAAVEAQTERGTRVPIIGVAKREEELIIKIDGSNIDVSGLTGGPEYTAQTSDGFVTVNLHPGLFKSSGHSLNLRSGGLNPQGGSKIHKYDDVIKLIQRIRDESHRFAVTYHSVLRSKQQTASVLDDVPTIGPATRKKLIRTFGSMRGVLQARDWELEKVIGEKKAAVLKQYLRPVRKEQRLVAGTGEHSQSAD